MSHRVRRQGLEPQTAGLRGRRSAIELAAHCLADQSRTGESNPDELLGRQPSLPLDQYGRVEPAGAETAESNPVQQPCRRAAP